MLWRLDCTSTKVHIVLLGDSIFDNSAYTGRDPDVVTHLRSLLPGAARATLCAVDGATVSGLAAQLRSLPDEATHLLISIGGNDALRNHDLLDMRVSSSAQALREFSRRIGAFEDAYRRAIDRVLELGRPTIVCTIYNGRLDKSVADIARLGLALFNDAIVRTAVERGLDVIELRAICSEASDYANPIEPSGTGGLKIARAIVHAIGEHDAGRHGTTVWGSNALR
ncbi:MAG TPA: GDSL-type esterase/lipase family protein [Vicinamibacterales bacterium]|nr:GDSL-type esterase/lipase family protein [Vicinamibacterales bacterium]